MEELCLTIETCLFEVNKKVIDMFGTLICLKKKQKKNHSEVIGYQVLSK